MSTSLEPDKKHPPERYDFAKIRLYVEGDLAAAGEVVLEKGQSHYMASVMRQKVGDSVLLFNGRDGEWLAEITSASKKGVSVELKERSRAQVANADLELLFAPIKKLRLDFLVQKATELGVSKIRPVVTQYTNAKVKHEKMLANVIEAAEQSGRLDVPNVEAAIALKDLISTWSAGRCLLFCDEAGDSPAMVQSLEASNHKGPWSILIGPEGGFSPKERRALREQSWSLPISLGPRIMRADTAAIAALAAFQALRGDW
jgi:16S rRNA (uracil1498-N3)-methyltransferase